MVAISPARHLRLGWRQRTANQYGAAQPVSVNRSAQTPIGPPPFRILLGASTTTAPTCPSDIAREHPATVLVASGAIRRAIQVCTRPALCSRVDLYMKIFPVGLGQVVAMTVVPVPAPGKHIQICRDPVSTRISRIGSGE